MDEAKDSRGKRKFWFPVWNGIFEHREKIKDALWLFLWYIDKTTREVDGGDGRKVGLVLGGKPIRDSQVARELQCSKRTVCSWRNLLADGGYIEATRAPYGYTVRVLKSKKWLGKNPVPLSAANEKDTASSSPEFGRNLPRDLPVTSQSEKQVTSQGGKQSLNLIKTTHENIKSSITRKSNQETDGLVTEEHTQRVDLAPDGYSAIDGCNWKNWADKKRFPDEIEKLLSQKGARLKQ
jgi:hypothetical protein